MNNVKVLLVDDHAIMRDGIRALLGSNQDIKIVGEATNGKEALEKTRELAPDVIVMDIAMPGIDGLEATRVIKKDNPEVKILILTQYDSKEYVLSALKAGASGYLPKRALGTELITAIHIVFCGGSFLHPSIASVLVDHYQHQRMQNKDPFDSLTLRQREILKLIAEGHTCKEIAAEVFISPKTVNGHRTGIMAKLGLHSHSELIKYVLHKGLLNLTT